MSMSCKFLSPAGPSTSNLITWQAEVSYKFAVKFEESCDLTGHYISLPETFCWDWLPWEQSEASNTTRPLYTHNAFTRNKCMCYNCIFWDDNRMGQMLLVMTQNDDQRNWSSWKPSTLTINVVSQQNTSSEFTALKRTQKLNAKAGHTTHACESCNCWCKQGPSAEMQDIHCIANIWHSKHMACRVQSVRWLFNLYAEAWHLAMRGTCARIVQHVIVSGDAAAVTTWWHANIDHTITGQASFIPCCKVDEICASSGHWGSIIFRTSFTALISDKQAVESIDLGIWAAVFGVLIVCGLILLNFGNGYH